MSNVWSIIKRHYMHKEEKRYSSNSTQNDKTVNKTKKKKEEEEEEAENREEGEGQKRKEKHLQT